LLVIATGAAPRGHVLAISGDARVSEIVAQGDGAIQAIAPIADGFLLIRSWGPDLKIEHHDRDGKLLRTLALPGSGISIDGIASATGIGHAVIACSGWTQPTRWVKYEAASGELETIFEIQPAADYSMVVARRVEAISKDSTRIPITVLARADAHQDGSAPAILYAYGAFGISLAPRFLGVDLAWIERGGIYAFANIRGGGEFGRAWHEEGVKLNKQRGADDFFAAASALVDQHWTSAQHLGVVGESSGGLIIGMAITQHPQQFRAAVARGGIFDVLRNETYANGRYNIGEFGSVNDIEQFRAMAAYSPLQHVRAKTAYPAVLLETGDKDEVVAPWQSRKFAAALQNATSSDYPVILLTRLDAGHGTNASFGQRVSDEAIMLDFFATQLGLDASANH
jgi:prolyl oligopeptidase